MTPQQCLINISFQAVFKLCKKEGKEYLLQAPNDIERDHWVHAISAVIRSMAVIAGLNNSVTAAEGASVSVT